MTSVSFVARATSIPFSIAAIVGLMPLMPTVATRHTSASLSSTARMAASGPEYAFAPSSTASASHFSFELSAASATARNSSGCERTMSIAFMPIEPVAPRITSFFTSRPTFWRA